MQGVIKSYDPLTGDGTVISDTTLGESELSPDALDGSIFRMLRPGPRVIFELAAGTDVDEQPAQVATTVRLGSEIDMGTPGFPDSENLPGPAPEARSATRQGDLI